MCKRISGRMRETKITNMELNWLYLALPGSQSTPLTLWSTGGVVKQHRIRDIGSGCYLFILAIPLRPGITRNPKHLLAGTSLGFDYMKKRKIYKWRWERRLQSGQSKFSPIGWKISWGERRLVRGRTSCVGEEK
jgi:hypothetical protein